MTRPQPSVLVVEDEAELRRTIAESLTEQGFVVAQSADGADALDRLEGSAYDAVVIDLRLPDADGVKVLDAAVGNKRQAARLLRLSRTTLIDKLNRLNVATPPEGIGATA